MIELSKTIFGGNKQKNMEKINKKKEIWQIVIGFAGVFLSTYGLTLFNRYVRMALPLGVRVPMTVLSYWIMAVVPLIIMLINKDKLSDYGFTRKKLFSQIFVGALIGIALSVVFTLIPHFIGLGGFVDSGLRYKYAWQFIFQFIYCIFAVGFVEEALFRGFFYEKIKRVGNSAWAIVISSVLFGLLHLFVGNWVQMIVTGLLGAFFCLCRNKIKYCSVLSLAIAHGIYDGMITVWASVFLK